MRDLTILTTAAATLLLSPLFLNNAHAQADQTAHPAGSAAGQQSGASGAGGAVTGRSGSASATGGEANDSLDSQDFVKRAAQSNFAEIKVSQLAESQAQSPEVKKFARQMIDDHTQANAELAKLAQTKNLKVPDDTDLMHKASMKMLQGKSGGSFDQAYMKQMDKDHQKTIKLFQSAATSPKVDKDLQALASKLLPKLQEHEHLVTQIKPQTSTRSASSE
jgi:putative membrane protein